MPCPKHERRRGKGLEVKALHFAKLVDGRFAVQVVPDYLQVLREYGKGLSGRSGSFVAILERLEIRLELGIEDGVAIPLLGHRVELPKLALTPMHSVTG